MKKQEKEGLIAMLIVIALVAIKAFNIPWWIPVGILGGIFALWVEASKKNKD
ncbi:MAG: hypothetical protein AAB373_06645 [Patescibacteria group bacterium]